MPLYYVAGGSGTGKSTALLELKRRGYEAYDVDEAGPVTAKWHNDETGYVHPKSSVKADQRTPDFLSAHSWKVSRQDVINLSRHAEMKNIFVGGTINNLDEISDLLACVFVLVIDNQTLKHRLLTRTTNDWGKSPHELHLTMGRNNTALESHEKKGHIIIDATQPTEKIVDEILSYVHEY